MRLPGRSSSGGSASGRSSGRMAGLLPGQGVSSAGSFGPAETSFDFLQGAFRVDEKGRIRGLLIAGASVSAFVLSLTAGGVLLAWNSQASAELARTSETVSRLSVELGRLSNTGGLGERELEGRYSLLSGHLALAQTERVDMLTVVNDMRASLPDGAQLASVDLARNETGVQTVTAQVTLDSFNRLTDLSDGLGRIWYLRTPQLTWSSGPDQVSATVTAEIDLALSSGRVMALRDMVAGAPAPAGPSEPAAGDAADAGADAADGVADGGADAAGEGSDG